MARSGDAAPRYLLRAGQGIPKVTCATNIDPEVMMPQIRVIVTTRKLSVLKIVRIRLFSSRSPVMLKPPSDIEDGQICA